MVRGLRWWIAGLIFLATLINFLNRLTIAVLGPVITAQLHLSNSEFAGLTTVFLVAYTLSQGLSGKLYDRIGTKRGFTVSIVVWSLASMAHAFARGFGALLVLRFVLGLGEAGNWPGAAKVIAEWFPVRQRALGMGIFNSGTSIGSVVAPPLLVWIELRYGWQATFLVLGALGFVWLVLWLRFYETPERHPAITPSEYALIRQDRQLSGNERPIPWPELLRRREAWAIVLARFCADPVWWLYITWLPLYLYNVRHFSLQQIGLFAWLPFVAADAGSLLGGWLSGHLDRARLERGPRAQKRHDRRHALYVQRHRGRYRPKRHGRVGADRSGAVWLSSLDQQRADPAERLFPGHRSRLGHRSRRGGRRHRLDSVDPGHRAGGGSHPFLYADSDCGGSAAGGGNGSFIWSGRHDPASLVRKWYTELKCRTIWI